VTRKHRASIPAPFGSIEPHAAMLTVPPVDQLLYKIMSVENLLRSIIDGYLHFNRVDSYEGFPGSDSYDGRQLPQDQQGNVETMFEKNPSFTSKHYYEQARTRTYACCFSMKSSDYIWKNYANDSEKGKVGIVFIFSKLRTMLNHSFADSMLECNGIKFRQIFDINYGVVNYIDWKVHQANKERLPNQIEYTYLKSNTFVEENEFRISLSAFGLGKFVLNDGSIIDFPNNLQLPFVWQAAIRDGVIQQILTGPSCDAKFLYAELSKLGISFCT